MEGRREDRAGALASHPLVSFQLLGRAGCREKTEALGCSRGRPASLAQGCPSPSQAHTPLSGAQGRLFRSRWVYQESLEPGAEMARY